MLITNDKDRYVIVAHDFFRFGYSKHGNYFVRVGIRMNSMLFNRNKLLRIIFC